MLEIKELSVRFSADSTVQAVQDVSLVLPDRGRIALVGETGSGKSVLLLAVMHLLPESAVVTGEVLLNGEDILKMNRKQLDKLRGALISYVPQGGGASLNPLMKGGEQVGEPLVEHHGWNKRESVTKAIEMMRSLNMGNEEELAASFPHTFSGGMRQRAMIAMGIIAGSKILLADEPSKGLDEDRVDLVVDSFNRLTEQSLLCVTHDLTFASRISDHICVLYSAAQVEFAKTEEILKDPLHPYTRDMVKAIPENGMIVDNVGFAPSHDDFDKGGCRYRHRCKQCTEKCNEMPPLFNVGERKVRCWLYENEN